MLYLRTTDELIKAAYISLFRHGDVNLNFNLNEIKSYFFINSYSYYYNFLEDFKNKAPSIRVFFYERCFDFGYLFFQKNQDPNFYNAIDCTYKIIPRSKVEEDILNNTVKENILYRQFIKGEL